MKTARQSNANTPLIKASTVLTELARHVTADDRKAAINEFGYNRMTIRYYLKGQVNDIDIAMNMIRFFRKRIEERENEL